MNTSVSVVILSFLSLLTVAGCSKKLDNAKLESSITEGLKAKQMTFKSVTCPPGRDIKVGDTFDCDATTAEGEKVAIKVEQKDDQGNINWKTTGIVASESALAAHLLPSLKGATAKCPEKTLVVKKGKTFTCDGTLEGKPAKVTFTAKDDEGNFHLSAKQDGAAEAAEGDAVDKE